MIWRKQVLDKIGGIQHIQTIQRGFKGGHKDQNPDQNRKDGLDYGDIIMPGDQKDLDELPEHVRQRWTKSTEDMGNGVQDIQGHITDGASNP